MLRAIQFYSNVQMINIIPLFYSRLSTLYEPMGFTILFLPLNMIIKHIFRKKISQFDLIILIHNILMTDTLPHLKQIMYESIFTYFYKHRFLYQTIHMWQGNL